MKLKALSSSDENQMLDLLRSERLSKESDFYIDRGTSFWEFYNWFSDGQNIAMGVFEGSQLIAMVVVAKLPFKFKGSPGAAYVTTDLLIHPDFRKTYAAAKIMTGLHTLLPGSGFTELWVENKPNFAEALPRISARHGYSSITPGETNLVTLFPNQKMDISVEDSSFEVIDDWAKIENHLQKYQAEIDSWADWNNPIAIKDIFKTISLFKYSTANAEISGLLIDRSNLQKVRWNGLTRLLIEKYKRALDRKNLGFTVDDELPFLNICFVTGTRSSIPSQLVSHLANWAGERNYFGVNIRDLVTDVPKFLDHTLFPRRIFLSSDFPLAHLHDLVKCNLNKNIVLESIYL